jgi:hypothetical protein
MQSFNRKRKFLEVPYVYKYSLLLVFLCLIPEIYKDIACVIIYVLQGIENSYYFKLNWYERYERIQCKMMLTTQVTMTGIVGIYTYRYLADIPSVGNYIWIALFVLQYVTYLYDLQLYNFTKRSRIFYRKDVSFVGNATI